MSMSTKKSRLLALSLPILAIAALGYFGEPTGLLTSLPTDPLSGRGQSTAYDTAEASVGSIHRVVATSGPVRPWVTVQIGSQLSGQIRRVLADFNSEVKEGDIVAELDATMFEAKVEQAAADLAMANAALTNQRAALAKAEAILEQAERARHRQQELSARGVTSKATLDTATRDKLVAMAEIAINNAQITNARANVLQREALLKQAQIELERTRIRSPINGVVVSRTVDVGQTVAASLQAPELFRIAQDLRNVRIEAHVNEADIGSIGQGNPATFTIDSYPGRVFVGKVAQVRLAPNDVQSVVTYVVLIEARNDDLKLFPGMTANVRIETARRERVLRIPNTALHFKPRGSRDADRRFDTERRQERMLEWLKEALRPTLEQVTSVVVGVAKRFKETLRPTEEQVASAVVSAAKRADKRRSEPGATDASDATEASAEAWPDSNTRMRPTKIWVRGPDGKAESRSIQLGLTDSRFAEVTNGLLKSGELVIVGTRRLATK